MVPLFLPQGKSLSFMAFALALDNFALIFSVIGAMKWESAIAHKILCVQVGLQAGIEGRTPILAQVYDKVCREDWAERSRRQDPDFDVNRMATSLNIECLNRAKVIHDQNGAPSQQSSRVSGQKGAVNFSTLQ